MALTKLGRVQGGSVFTASIQSTNSVAIANVQPADITPMVGDSILFIDGDIRQIINVSASLITCGDIIAKITGASAGFGSPIATVDNGVGTPEVTVTASGENTAKVFNFAFKNIKGDKGDKGESGNDGNFSCIGSYTDGKIADIQGFKINSLYFIVGIDGDKCKIVLLITSSDLDSSSTKPKSFKTYTINGLSSGVIYENNDDLVFSDIPIGQVYYIGSNIVFNFEPTTYEVECACCGGTFTVAEEPVEGQYYYCPDCVPN